MALFHTTVVDNQIKALPTIATASGAVANFTTDKAENLVDCVCEVASGASEINVVACGKNLANLATRASATVANITSEIQSDNRIIASGVSSGNGDIYCYFVTPIYLNGTFTLSLNGTDTRTGTLSVFFHNYNGGYISPVAMSKDNHSLTTTLNGTYDHILLRTSNTNSITLDCKLMIELGTPATAYEAYNGNTYNIPFGETLSDTAIYNAVTGVLTRNDTTTKQLDSCPIVTIANSENNIWADTGDISVQFVLSVGEYVNQNV